MIIEDIALAEHELAANDLITSGGIAGKIDAANKVLLLFIEIEGEVDRFGAFVDIRERDGSEINIAVHAV